MGFTFASKTLTNTHIIIFIFLLKTPHVFPQSNTIRIDQKQALRDGQTIVSPQRIFELGFFTPGTSISTSSSRYVGIWYYGHPNRTAVWVANRDNPIPNDSGVFRFQNGSLIVSDQNGVDYWSSNTSSPSSSSLNLTVTLIDTGNLIISTVENAGDDLNAIWRSCDHPTDTYLPNSRVYLNFSEGIDRKFVSWRTANDPSKGNYSMGVDQQGSPQVVIWDDRSNRRLWRTGHWNYQIFIGIPRMRSLLLFGFRLVPDSGLMYFVFDNPADSPLMRFMIQWNGTVQQLTYDNRTGTWNVSLSQPSVGCEEYNKCGNFGICRTSDSQSICGCMNGFDPNPRFREQWNNGNWSGGCVRRTRLECSLNGSTSDGFVPRPGVKLPDFADLVAGNNNDCENGCLRNCSCIAYAFVSGIGCLVWGNELVDVEQFEQGGKMLFVRVSSADLVSGSDDGVSKTTVIAISVTCAVVLGVLALLLWRYRKKVIACRVPCGEPKNGPLVTEVLNGQDISVEVSEQLECERKECDGPPLPVFSSSLLEAATDGFANKNKLGQGGFGPVHKGILPEGQEIAVKRLAKSSGQGLEEFKNEMILIAKLQHRNLVRLMGYCIEGEERMLVYEYMPNKSLDSFLFDRVKKAELDWKTRFKIIEGIARGLLYLHRDSRLRIIHRDLKVSNILLDEEMNPKISDFGMARIFGGNQNEANTNRVVGTYGYMSPEYAMEGLFSVKSDVYSFGVLLLEIISGHRNNSFRSDDSTNLIRHAWKLWKEGKPEELIDPLIVDSCYKTEALQCIHVAMLCVQSSAVQRPTMSSVVFMLEGENTSLPQPSELDITSLSSAEMDLIMEGREINVSSNVVTITEVSGR